jgi:hypothetical protein
MPLSGDLWSDAPAPEPKPVPTEPAPPWWWDVNRSTGDSLLRSRAGGLLLAIMHIGESWGIFQLQRDWDLIQIRSDRAAAMDEALRGAKRAGLIQS